MTIYTEENLSAQILPQKGRLIGLDIGTKRIGIALSDESRFIANPKLILTRQGNLKDFTQIEKMILEYQPCGIVMGFPQYLGGSYDAMSDFILAFAKNFDEFLQQKYPIFLINERLSSFEAQEYNFSEIAGKKKGKTRFYDDIAASIILQRFLDKL
jgi:putative Holliday junction resolvase